MRNYKKFNTIYFPAENLTCFNSITTQNKERNDSFQLNQKQLVWCHTLPLRAINSINPSLVRSQVCMDTLPLNHPG